MLAKWDIWKYRFHFSLVNVITKIKNSIQADANTMTTAMFEKKWLEFILILQLYDCSRRLLNRSFFYLILIVLIKRVFILGSVDNKLVVYVYSFHLLVIFIVFVKCKYWALLRLAYCKLWRL